jgi:hypothetical protein
MFIIDWQIGYIIYMSEGLVGVIAMQISIEQFYWRNGVRFNTLNIGGLFSMYAFRMKWRFAGAHLPRRLGPLVSDSCRHTHFTYNIYRTMNTCENKVGSERNQLFNFPSEIAVALRRMPFPFCICMFWVSLCTRRRFLDEITENWNVSQHHLWFFTFLMRSSSVLLFCHNLIIFFKFKEISRWSSVTRTKRNSLCDVVKAEELRKHSINKLQGAEPFMRSQKVLS